MAGKTNYLENALMNHIFQNVTYTPPSKVYLALFTTDPGDTGSQDNELPSGNGYSRTEVIFSDASNGAVSNTQAVIFPQATSDWPTVTHVGIMDAPSGGNMLYTGSLTSPVTIVSGDSLRIDIGNLTISED